MRYISSQWMSEANEQMWSEDLAKMRDMEINAIRIGSHVEKDGFYTMCDEMGFLVWQVFPLHYCVSDSRRPDRARERHDPRHGPDALQPREHRHVVGLQGARGLPAPRQAEQLPPAVPDPEGVARHGRPDALDPPRRLPGGRLQPDDRLLLGRRHATSTRSTSRRTSSSSAPARSRSARSLETFIPDDKLWPPDWDTWEYHGFFYNLAFGFAKVEMQDTLEEFIDDVPGRTRRWS